jgi:two-component SAPR family response regulator
MDGIELATRIHDLQGHTSVIFVTAYNQYAVEAFRLNALDYLMKPVSMDRLKETLCRIMDGKLPAPMGELSVHCFGRFRVSSGKEEVRFRTEKAEELLAFLIDCRSGFVSRGKILDNLWEDFEGDRAITHFNTTLHYVKKALFQNGIQLSFLYDRGSYRLDTDGIHCDYIEFCTFIEKQEAATWQNIHQFEEMTKLYSGEYLLGWEYGWVSGKRLRLEEQFINLLLEVSRYYKEAGDYQKCTKWLRNGLLHEPLHRELNYRIVEALLLKNERALAVRYYELYRGGLKKMLQADPDEAFIKLLK